MRSSMASKIGAMNASEAKRWLRKHGVDITRPAKGGHLLLTNPANGQTTILPYHGSKKEIGKGLWEKIKKDLGLK